MATNLLETVGALNALDAQIAAWEAVTRDAQGHIAELLVERVQMVAAERHPDARSLHLHRDSEGYLIGGLFAADGRDMIDGTEDIDGIDPHDELVDAVSALPSGAVEYERAAEAHVINLPGGPARCVQCYRTVDEDDSCADDVYGRHRFA